MTSPPQVTHESVDVEGATLSYDRKPASGDRRFVPVILLHPWFGCCGFWRHTVAALPEFETYAVDLYSLGAGAEWRKFASPRGLSRAVGAMLDTRRIDRCSVIGNSMGGIAAQDLAARDANRINKLILVGTGARTVGVKPDFRKSLDDWIAGDADRAFTERLVGSLLARRPDDPREFESFVNAVADANKSFMGSVLRDAFEFDLRPVLPNIKATTLVIRGSLDAARTQTHVDELLAGIPHGRAAEIPEGGHSPQVDSSRAFSALVRSFLLN
jgi:3-oxoadipate enol-lactonase